MVVNMNMMDNCCFCSKHLIVKRSVNYLSRMIQAAFIDMENMFDLLTEEIEVG